jgi:hypothetical protein
MVASLLKKKDLRLAAPWLESRWLSAMLSNPDDTFPQPDNLRGTQGSALARPTSPGQPGEISFVSQVLPELLPSQAERGAPEPDVFEFELTPETPRTEPASLLLETRGVTSHQKNCQGVMWEREITWKESILAKLREIGKLHLAGKMVECHTIATVKQCTGCKKRTTFYNRCEKFFCPTCAPRLARERKESIEWWTRQVKQPKHLVLTVRNTLDLTKPYVQFIKEALSRLRRCKVFSSVKGGFYSMEVTNEGNGWHLHFHLLIDTPWLCMPELSQVWGKLVGQDYAIVKIKDCRGAEYLKEVTKYAVKGNDLAKLKPALIAEFIEAFSGVRFFGVFGSLYGKRTEWAEWIKTLQEIKPLCSCGCNSWRMLSPEQALWEDETRGGAGAIPPPQVHQVPLNQEELALEGTRTFVWPR